MKKESVKPMGSEKRAEIVEQAFDVFFKNGFHAAGVDSLLGNTGISKRTLYKHFKSKDELIKATIEHYARTTFQSISSFIENTKVRSPQAKALLIFDWLETVIASGHTLGCFAINAKTEYAGRNAEIENCCENYFEKVDGLLTALLEGANCRQSKKIARQFLLLFSGAIVTSQGRAEKDSAQVAKAAAKSLLESACEDST